MEQDPLVVLEPSVLGDTRGRLLATVEETKDDSLLDKTAGFTRAELTIQRVETHLLDPSPFNLDQSTTDSTNEGKRLVASSDNINKESLSVEETLSSRNIRVAVVGNVDAGKSTLIGSLTTSTLDDGRGKCRTSIMKHRHEIETGRTSTATSHLLGFRSTGEPIAGKDQVRVNKRKGEDEIARESYRVITLMDLAGHEKYLKTTYVAFRRRLSKARRGFAICAFV
jgi:ribosome biogenesis GTPase A